MEEISNKTLATLLVVAIVISLAGTFFAMRGVSQVTNIVSGAATTSGTARVNVSETVSITLTQNSVNFGSGQRNFTIAASDLCNLTTDAPRPDCWNATGFVGSDFKVENDGNVNVNVTIQGNASSAAFFTSGCEGTCSYAGGADGIFMWKGVSSLAVGGFHAGGCTGTLTSAETGFNSAVKQLLCTNLTSTDATDAINITIKVGVPAGPSGDFRHDVTFEGLKNY